MCVKNFLLVVVVGGGIGYGSESFGVWIHNEGDRCVGVSGIEKIACLQKSLFDLREKRQELHQVNLMKEHRHKRAKSEEETDGEPSPFHALGKSDPQSLEAFEALGRSLKVRPTDAQIAVREVMRDAFEMKIHANFFQIEKFREKHPTYSYEEAMQLARIPERYVPWAANLIQQDWYKQAFPMAQVCQAKAREFLLAQELKDTSPNKVFTF